MHSHDHAHSHAPHAASMGRAFFIGIVLNTAFILLEIFYGLKIDSLALLADAGHNVSDVLGLLMAWGALWLSRFPGNERFTYGLQSGTMLAALANALLLLVAVGIIIWEAIRRFAEPEPILTGTMMAVAGLGILVNGFTALLFMKGQHDLNVRGAFLHMAADAGISLGVVISALVIALTGWLWLDSAVSIVIALVIVVGTWGLLRDALRLVLHAVPEQIRLSEVRDYLQSIEGVERVHDLHVWAMSTTQVALSVHLYLPQTAPPKGLLHHISHELEERFGIHHATIQLECGEADCTLHSSQCTP